MSTEPENELSRSLRTLLAHHDATSAGEVTADAAQIALNVILTRNGSSPIDDMQAALAAALPALVQQVERLTTEVGTFRRTYASLETTEQYRATVISLRNDRHKLTERNAHLSAENARLEHLCGLLKTGLGAMGGERVIAMAEKQAAVVDALVSDAATAQAKQAEGDNE